MTDTLSIDVLAMRDDTIIKKEFYQYLPYTASYGENEEIRIAIQSKDSYLLPCESYLYMKISATTAGAFTAGDDEVKFVSNFSSYLFSDARYLLNDIDVDVIRNAGVASTMKLVTASRITQLYGYAQYCKTYESTSPRSDTVGGVKNYDVVLPLSVLFGFCDDYRKIIINCKHELVLNRARQSLDLTTGGGEANTATTVTVALNKIEWRVPHITLSDEVRLSMYDYLKNKQNITIQFRSMDLMVYPALPHGSSSHLWSVKTVKSVNKPRLVIVGMQTARNGVRRKNASRFDACNVTGVRLHLNSQIFPYSQNDLDIGGGLYAELYHSFMKIQNSYYNGTEPLNPFFLACAIFQNTPLFAFDTSRMDESMINSSIDIRVEIKASQNFPDNTVCYCLIIYDNEFIYSPFDSIVTRKI